MEPQSVTTSQISNSAVSEKNTLTMSNRVLEFA